MFRPRQDFVFCLVSWMVLLISCGGSAARCPASWSNAGNGHCYKVTAEHEIRDEAQKACVRMLSTARLPNAFTVTERTAIGRVLGKHATTYEVWVYDCGATVSGSGNCRVMTNYDALNTLNYRCFAKKCTAVGRRVLCKAAADTVDSCFSSPCQHGGTCSDGYYSYSCRCPQGITGRDCETNIDDCKSRPCQHGGTCRDHVNDFTCACVAGYTGKMCQTDIDECSSSPCQNGGTCEDKINGFICSCRDGFMGILCETDIDECSSSPCQNGGTCEDKVNGFICTCRDGFTGRLCEREDTLLECSPCENGGRCVNRPEGYTCLCVPGFTGKNCHLDVDECLSSPCLHGGSCNDNINSYTCSCQPGYTGRSCETEIDECQSQPCEHNGACIDKVDGYKCACLEHFIGAHCEAVYSSSTDCTKMILVTVFVTLLLVLVIEAVIFGTAYLWRRRANSETDSKSLLKDLNNTCTKEKQITTEAACEQIYPVYETAAEPYSIVGETVSRDKKQVAPFIYENSKETSTL